MSRIAGASFGVALIAALALICGSALAVGGASKDEAVVMVKKAVAYIKSEGPKTAYPAIDDQSGQFVDRDLYIVVYGMDGTVSRMAPIKRGSAPTSWATRTRMARRSSRNA